MVKFKAPDPIRISGFVIAGFAAMGLLLMFCAIIGGWGDRGLDHQCDYVAIAKQETHKAYPEYNTENKTAIEDRGRVVTVFYPLPYPRPSGSPRIDIEKGTCRVTSVSHDA
jgi:hypothetical protein